MKTEMCAYCCEPATACIDEIIVITDDGRCDRPKKFFRALSACSSCASMKVRSLDHDESWQCFSHRKKTQEVRP